MIVKYWLSVRFLGERPTFSLAERGTPMRYVRVTLSLTNFHLESFSVLYCSLWSKAARNNKGSRLATGEEGCLLRTVKIINWNMPVTEVKLLKIELYWTYSDFHSAVNFFQQSQEKTFNRIWLCASVPPWLNFTFNLINFNTPIQKTAHLICICLCHEFGGHWLFMSCPMLALAYLNQLSLILHTCLCKAS